MNARVGFIVTNLSRSGERVTWFYNQRGKAEQYIKEGKREAETMKQADCAGDREYVSLAAVPF